GSQVFRSLVPEDPALATDGKIVGYCVLLPGVTQSQQTRALASQSEADLFPFTVMCVGGDDRRAMRVVHIVKKTHVGNKIQFGVNPVRRTTAVRQDPGGPDTLSLERGINPPRPYLPLLLNCKITSERIS